MKRVLGIKVGEGHDCGAALLDEQDGELRCVALSEERLSRIKHDNAFPRRAIESCLAHAGIALSDVDLVCFDKLRDGISTLDHLAIEHVPAHTISDDERELIAAAENARAVVVNHHLAHAASAFAVTPIPDAAVLILDGSGTRFPLAEGDQGLIAMGDSTAPDDVGYRYYGRSAETQSVYHATRDANNRPVLRRIVESRRSGIGHFYTFFSRHVLGFGQHQEGKAMGLAAWGDASRVAGPPDFPPDLFTGIDSPLLEHCKRVEFRPPRRDKSIDPTDPRYADIAAWMQHVLSAEVLRLARLAVERTGARNLCMAGGVALNVVANRLVRDTLVGEGLIDDVFVQPAASDTGTPLGAALHGYYTLLGGTLPFQDNIVYLGPEHSVTEAESFMLARGAVQTDDVCERTADLLLDGKIVGWWQGRSEHGPRALGARSILCWPQPDWMKAHLNARVKHREMFRPFAPIIAEERAHEVFDNDFPVPYMLMNTAVRPEFRDRLPAITHIDGSGRLQTVAAPRTPLLHELLGVIQKRDGVGVLLNTSFNDAGEPIVETPEHAFNCFRSTNIDALVVGRTILTKD